MAAPNRVDQPSWEDAYRRESALSAGAESAAVGGTDDSAAARWPANANAVVWAIGNGLVSSTLIVYLVQGLGASGFWVGLILAAPQFIGLGRLGAARFSLDKPSRKRFCIATYFASGLVLAVLPVLAVNHQRFLPQAALGGVVAVWCLYHLLEYLGTVALWAWLRDLVPLSHRGLFIGRREQWLNGGRMTGMLAGGLFAWQCADSSDWKWAAYVVPAAVGSLFLMAAAIPLLALPAGPATLAIETADAKSGQLSGFRWRNLLTPLFDPRLSRLMIFGCWFSFFNGLTQSAQGVFPVRMLDLPLIWLLGLRTVMTFGQTLVSPQIGRCADRLGNRPVLIVSQAIVAIGLWGYMKATPEHAWLIAVAWLLWVAYAGINIGVPNLLLKLSPPGQAGACVAGYFALTGICYGVSTILGGLAFDYLQGQTIFVRNAPLDRYQFMFLFGIITRMTGAVFLLAVDEPPPVVPREAVVARGQTTL